MVSWLDGCLLACLLGWLVARDWSTETTARATTPRQPQYTDRGSHSIQTEAATVYRPRQPQYTDRGSHSILTEAATVY